MFNQHFYFGTIAYDGDGKLYVGESRSGQIFVYTAEGKFERQFGSPREGRGAVSGHLRHHRGG